MTEVRKPPACHYDRQLGERVTREHRDDCTDPIGHSGCVPCTAPHCIVCGREHATNDQPRTCPKCQGRIDQDLAEIATSYAALFLEALEAGADGHLVAAAPIPGGTAAVLTGPSVRLDVVRISRTTHEDHRPKDPIPPLAVLAQWEDMYRVWLDHPTGRRATVGGAIAYLREVVPQVAQRPDGPDFLAFTRQIQTLRSHLEHALHNEQEPERGVECFECGDQLVRRFRVAKRCQHSTPARREMRRWLQLGYPEAISPLHVREALKPCGRCNQGGIDDPSAGLSWECPGCRREYKPGEYANAVRRDLVEHGAEGDGWTHVSMAAAAASTLVGIHVPDSTVRKWMDRGKVMSLCLWHHAVPKDHPPVPAAEEVTDWQALLDSYVGRVASRPWGQRLVYWPDVADQAVEAVDRARAAAEERRRRAAQLQALGKAIAAGEDPDEAGARLGIHPARVEVMLAELERASADGGRVSA